MTRVVVLGGAGAMGRAAATLTATFPEVTSLVIADARLDAAQQAAAALVKPGLRVSAERVDVLDPRGLRAVLHDAQAVLNTTGPFFRLGVPALQAAIATGTTYLDICDDPAPTRALLDLHQDAAEAGVSAVIGIGASPGLSNLLAVCAAERLDVVDNLYCAWPVDAGQPTTERTTTADPSEFSGPDGTASAAVVHWLEQLRGTVPTVCNGHPDRQRPLTPVPLTYPGRRGGTAYLVGHPEPLTLPESLDVRGSSACLMIVTPGTVAYLRGVARDVDAGRITERAGARLIVQPRWRRVLRAALSSRRLAGPGDLPPFFSLVTGTRGGRPTTVAAQLKGLPDVMSTITGVPLALALRQVLGDGIVAGVHPPERVLDAHRLLAALADVPALQDVDGSGPTLDVRDSS